MVISMNDAIDQNPYDTSPFRSALRPIVAVMPIQRRDVATLPNHRGALEDIVGQIDILRIKALHCAVNRAPV